MQQRLSETSTDPELGAQSREASQHNYQQASPHHCQQQSQPRWRRHRAKGSNTSWRAMCRSCAQMRGYDAPLRTLARIGRRAFDAITLPVDSELRRDETGFLRAQLATVMALAYLTYIVVAMPGVVAQAITAFNQHRFPLGLVTFAVFVACSVAAYIFCLFLPTKVLLLRFLLLILPSIIPYVRFLLLLYLQQTDGCFIINAFRPVILPMMACVYIAPSWAPALLFLHLVAITFIFFPIFIQYNGDLNNSYLGYQFFLWFILTLVMLHFMQGLINGSVERSRRLFISSASHELRTPLHCITTALEVLSSRPEALTASDKSCVDIALQSTEQMELLVSDLLSLGELQSSTQKPAVNLTTVTVESLIARSLQFVKLQAAAKGITIAMDISPNCPAAIVTDQRRTAQILCNYLSNAIKFSPPNSSIRVVADVTRGQLMPHANVPGGRALRISVIDQGPGISRAGLERLFVPFARLNTAVPGTGLGLSIAKATAAALGGTCGLDSEPGHGSCAWFTLPLRVPVAGAAETVVPTQHQQPIQPTGAAHGVQQTTELSNMSVASQPPSSLSAPGADVSTTVVVCVSPAIEVQRVMHTEARPAVSVPIVDVVVDSSTQAGAGTVNPFTQARAHRSPTSTRPAATHIPVDMGASQPDATGAARCEEVIISKGAMLPEVTPKSTSAAAVSNGPSPQPQRQPQPRPQPSTSVASSLSFLLVDDNRVNLKVLTMLLNNVVPGCVIRQCEDGLEAVQLCEQAAASASAGLAARAAAAAAVIPEPSTSPLCYDVIFMDYHMPVMDGVTATQRIRSMQVRRHHDQEHVPAQHGADASSASASAPSTATATATPCRFIVGLTADSSASTVKTLLGAGMDRVLTKPLRKDAVLGVLRELSLLRS